MKLLNKKQIKANKVFIKDYIKATNSADASKVDANANVNRKTLASMESEMYKLYTIQLNRGLVYDKLVELYDKDTADTYLDDIESHIIYVHDETSLRPYCASISLYPFLILGTKAMGGTSSAPTNLQSFCGGFLNLMYQVASNFCGAIATVEFLMYFDYFARKTYGNDYLYYNSLEVMQELQGVVYGINQPSSTRGDQSVFWNISVFDKYYFEELFGNFVFPDGSSPNYSSLALLQDFFMNWFGEERRRELLTFPVLTSATLYDEKTKEIKDEKFNDMLCYHMSKGLSFFNYMSDKADSLASCCRLRNELADNTFSFTLGAGGVSTGSDQVITINLNRVEQLIGGQHLFDKLIDNVHKYLMAHRSVHKDFIDAGILPAYTAGFIDHSKQFSTIGINGAVEGAEYIGCEIGYNEYYVGYLSMRLKRIKELNKEAYKKYGVRFNTEFVPAENLGIKNAKWDREAGLSVPRDCYNSYFYAVESDIDIIDKFKLHGAEVTQYLDGGSALHLNLESIPTFTQAKQLFDISAVCGTNYWTFNVLSTICNDCGYIDPHTNTKCVKCGCIDVDYGTRVIGYLKRISDFSEGRRKETGRRFYNEFKR